MIAPGSQVTEGQPVMELETDKAVIEVPSSVSGTVKEIHVHEGEKVKVGQVIFTVDNGSGGVVSRAASSVKEPEPAAVPETPVQKPVASAKSDPAMTAVAPLSPSVTEFKLPELGENI